MLLCPKCKHRCITSRPMMHKAIPKPDEYAGKDEWLKYEKADGHVCAVLLCPENYCEWGKWICEISEDERRNIEVKDENEETSLSATHRKDSK